MDDNDPIMIYRATKKTGPHVKRLVHKTATSVKYQERIIIQLKGLLASGTGADAEGFLESERLLSTRLGVARNTLRKVLPELEKEGVIVTDKDNRRRLSSQQEQGVAQKKACLILPVLNSFTQPIVQGATERSSSLGWSLDILLSHARPDYEMELIGRIREQQDMTGIMILGCAPTTVKQRQYYNELLQQNYPLVFVDHDWEMPRSCLVQNDFRRTVFQLVDLLFDAGHSRISFVSLVDHYLIDDQLSMFFLKMQQKKILDWEKYHITFEYTDVIEDEKNIKEIRSKVTLAKPLQAMMRRSEPPTAFYCADGFMATVVILELLAMGITPGKDVAVVSSGASPLAELNQYLYAWTTHNCFGIGAEAMNILHRIRLGQYADSLHILVTPRLEGPFQDANGRSAITTSA